jgi:hypothetical protein
MNSTENIFKLSSIDSRIDKIKNLRFDNEELSKEIFLENYHNDPFFRAMVEVELEKMEHASTKIIKKELVLNGE